MKSFFWIVTLFFSLFAKSSFAQIPERPTPEKLVNNLSKEFPDFLSQQEEQQLEHAECFCAQEPGATSGDRDALSRTLRLP